MDTQLSALITNKAISENLSISFFYKIDQLNEEHSGWIFLHGSEDQNYLDNGENYVSVPLHELVLHLPHLREYLDSPIGSEFEYNHELSKYIEVSKEGKDLFVLESEAARPGKVKANFFLWAKNYPFKIILPFLFLSFAFWATLSESGVNHLWGYLFLFVLAVGFQFRKFYEHFRSGSICPAKVISEKPFLVAVYTDLSKGEGYFPVIKVVKMKESKTLGFKLGDSVPVVSLYNINQTKPYWKDFSPLPVYCATNDYDDVSRVLSMVTKNELEFIDCELERVPKPVKAGTYRIETEYTDW